MAHSFNPSLWEAETGDICEFEAGLIYIESSITTRATQRNVKKKKNLSKVNHFQNVSRYI